MTAAKSHDKSEPDAIHGFPAPLYDFFFKRRGDRSLALYFRRNGASVEDAEDLVQETILKTVQHFPSYRAESKLATWIWAVARNQLLDSLRRRSYRAEDATEPRDVTGLLDGLFFEQSEEQRALGKEHHEKVEAAFRKFESERPQAAEAVRMFVLEEMTIAEIAGVFGRSQPATREFISVARKQFIKYLKEALDVA